MVRDSGGASKHDVLQPDHSLDLFEFVRAQRSVSGAISVVLLPRLLAEVPPEAADLPAPLSWQAHGSLQSQADEGGQHDERWLDVGVSGAVWLECQRCLSPYLHALDVKARYRIVETEAQADAAPVDDDDADVVVGSRQFDLVELIEEEILLSLPLVPKHAVCPAVHDSLSSGVDGGLELPDAAAADEAPPEQEKIRPFAGLAALTRGGDKSGKS
jgi:uncharacterized protein